MPIAVREAGPGERPRRRGGSLHEEAGLTVAEIAAATGTNEEAAKSRLRYAMAKLKAAVDD